MAINYDSFSSAERDTFVKHVLTEPEIKAAVFLATGKGKKQMVPEELLEFCFKIAVKKMNRLHDRIREAR